MLHNPRLFRHDVDGPLFSLDRDMKVFRLIPQLLEQDHTKEM